MEEIKEKAPELPLNTGNSTETPPSTPPIDPALTPATILNEPVQNTLSVSSLDDKSSFEHVQRVAKMLSSSSLVPKEFQGNIQNTVIALEVARRIGASPLMVMQNLYIVHGKPSWSSSFIIAAINACKKFSPLRFDVTGEKDGMECKAWAYDLSTGDKLEGPRVTMTMAKDEGWVSKSGSKWKTMPELMMRYRSAAFFGRLYAPEILMGMHTADEVEDIEGNKTASRWSLPENQ